MTPPIRYLVLWATSACNLDCGYCYRQERGGQAMPVDTAFEALRLAASSGRSFHVQLAGGEPTLAPALVERVIRKVRQEGWPATLALQTNGVQFPESLIRLCGTHRVEVGLSVDGPPAVQEEIRGKAAATYRTLARLAEAGIPVRITSVLSSLNVAHLDRLALALAAHPNVAGLALDPLVLAGSAAFRDDLVPSETSTVAGIRSLHRAIHEIRKTRGLPFAWRELSLVETALGGKRPEGSDYCHACRGESLAVAPDGRIYPCSQAVGDPTLAAGTLGAIDWGKLRSAYSGLRMQGPCGDCPLDGRCPGDCPSRLRHDIRSSLACAIYRTLARCIHEPASDLLLQRHGHRTPNPERGPARAAGREL